MRLAVSVDHASVTPGRTQPRPAVRKQRVAGPAVALETFPPTVAAASGPLSPEWAKLRTATDGRRKANMPRIDDLSDAEFMKLEADYGDSLPICPICTLEDVRHLLLELVAGDAVSDEVKSALASVLYAVTGALVADRTMAEQGGALLISVAMRTAMKTGRPHEHSRFG